MSDEIELRAAWSEAIGTGRDAENALDSLLARHREPHRRYHGLRHVVWVVRHVHELAGELPVGDVAAVVAAACFHDAIYDPQRPDNEKASAALASRELGALGWTEVRCKAVATMICATAGHATDPGAATDDTAVLLDADLAVLGADAAGYQAYVTGVRAEYAHVDDEAWRSGRSAFLDRVLGRDAIYATSPGRRRWEARARANVAAELASLR
jgi:predicted metal-dependent HD superfamily phosphohydrolase